MAQSQPDLGGLQPFYGWYKQVSGNATTDTPNSNINQEL